MSEERTRRVFHLRTRDGAPCSVIVIREGVGSEARVLLSHHGVERTTAAMSRREAGKLADALKEAAA